MHAQNTSVEINTIFFTEKNQTKTQVTEVHLPFVLYLIYQIPGTQLGPLVFIGNFGLVLDGFFSPNNRKVIPRIVYRLSAGPTCGIKTAHHSEAGKTLDAKGATGLPYRHLKHPVIPPEVNGVFRYILGGS